MPIASSRVVKWLMTVPFRVIENSTRRTLSRLGAWFDFQFNRSSIWLSTSFLENVFTIHIANKIRIQLFECLFLAFNGGGFHIYSLLPVHCLFNLFIPWWKVQLRVINETLPHFHVCMYACRRLEVTMLKVLDFLEMDLLPVPLCENCISYGWPHACISKYTSTLLGGHFLP